MHFEFKCMNKNCTWYFISIMISAHYTGFAGMHQMPNILCECGIEPQVISINGKPVE